MAKGSAKGPRCRWPGRCGAAGADCGCSCCQRRCVRPSGRLPHCCCSVTNILKVTKVAAGCQWSQVPMEANMSGKSARTCLLSEEQFAVAAPGAARPSEQLGQAPVELGDIFFCCDYDHDYNRVASARGQQRATGRRAQRAQRGGEKPKDPRFSGGRAASTGTAGYRRCAAACRCSCSGSGSQKVDQAAVVAAGLR